MINRRQFLMRGAATGAGLVVVNQLGWPGALRARAQTGQTQLPGSSLPQFITPLPLLSVAGGPMETVVAGNSEIALTMREFKANVLPPGFVLPDGSTYGGTWSWGYRAGITPANPAGTYIGPVIVAGRGTPTQVRYVNDLTPDHVFWREWTDQTLHWADPLHSGAQLNSCASNIVAGQPPQGYCADHYDGPAPAVPHLHGGELPPVIDGGPDSWFTASDGHHGHAYYTMPGVSAAPNEAVYRYPNTQEAAPLWFHDHVLGATRLNVFAGLAGAYPLIDPGLTLPTGLDPVGLRQGASGRLDYLIPMVLQGRSFDTNGQWFFPTTGINPEHPYWIPEFEGDSTVVNGVTWPFLNVEPRRYRFLFINGSNARAYEMFITNPVTKVNGPPIWQIGTDGGYLDAPVKIDPNAPKGQLQKLLFMPGERADVIIDFAGFAGQTLLLRNTGRHPFPKGVPPQGSTIGQVMVFRVGSGPVADASYDPATSTQPLRPAGKKIVRLVDPATGTLATGVTADKTRQLTLNEVIGPGGPLEILVNNTKWDGTQGDGSVRDDFTPMTVGGVTEYFSEFPNEGDTEVWEIVNLTGDAHPIHTHLTQYQLINRQNFNTNKYGGAYSAAFPGGVYIPAYGPPLNYNTGNPRALGGNPDITPYLQGAVMPPAANEAGWKDTAIMYPGQVTRIAVRYAPTDTPQGANGSYPFDPDAKISAADDGHGYVWHCHIIDHEDNEMMRPYRVNAKDVKRTYVQGTDDTRADY
jgi:spore coat protein A